MVVSQFSYSEFPELVEGKGKQIIIILFRVVSHGTQFWNKFAPSFTCEVIIFLVSVKNADSRFFFVCVFV